MKAADLCSVALLIRLCRTKSGTTFSKTRGALSLGDWAGVAPERYSIATGLYPMDYPRPGLQSHPCLILKVQQGRSTGRVRCLVAYGSTNLNEGKYGEASDLIISNLHEIKAVGLFKPTRFYLKGDLIVPLYWDENDFECWDGAKSPVLGRLTSSLIIEVERCLAYRALHER